jgi:hypothetical protein
LNYNFDGKTLLFINIGLLIVGAAFLRGLTPEGYDFGGPTVWWSLIPIGLIVIFVALFVELYYEVQSSSGSRQMNSKENDWVLLIESQHPENIASIIESLEDADYRYFHEEEEKPIWEPLPHSTQKIYVPQEELDEVENHLTEKGLTKEE